MMFSIFMEIMNVMKQHRLHSVVATRNAALATPLKGDA
jgi:hypothetical protein